MTKTCISCGKEISDASTFCSHCGASQDVEKTEVVPISAPVTHAQVSSRSHVTMMGMRVEDIQAAVAAREAEEAPAQPETPAAEAPTAEPSSEANKVAPVLDATPVRGLPVVDELKPKAPVAPAPRSAPLSSIARFVMASGGLVLIALFSLPWRGVSSWQLLETLVGADFVRQLFFLAGGAVLVATAILPVPALFRALVGACIAAVPLVLGAEGLLEGWRGVVGALVIIGLPAALLQLRPRRGTQGPARALLVVAFLGLALVYVAPISNVMPIVYVVQLLRSGLVAQIVIGIFLVVPLFLGMLSLLGLVARDVLSAAVLLSVLLLLWPPAAILYFRIDGTQAYVALALLWTAIIAALCAAQLLAMVSRPQPRT